MSDSERAELDKMIAEARLRKTGQVKLSKYLLSKVISGLGTARVWIFVWMVEDEVRGTVGWRAYGADDEISKFQAEAAKYFADGVEAKRVVMRTPDGRTERLR